MCNNAKTAFFIVTWALCGFFYIIRVKYKDIRNHSNFSDRFGWQQSTLSGCSHSRFRGRFVRAARQHTVRQPPSNRPIGTAARQPWRRRISCERFKGSSDEGNFRWKIFSEHRWPLFATHPSDFSCSGFELSFSFWIRLEFGMYYWQLGWLACAVCTSYPALARICIYKCCERVCGHASVLCGLLFVT